MPSMHRDGPMNHNQIWKTYRLADAGWSVDYLARMFGRDEKEITAAITSCEQHLATAPPPEAA